MAGSEFAIVSRRVVEEPDNLRLAGFDISNRKICTIIVILLAISELFSIWRPEVGIISHAIVGISAAVMAAFLNDNSPMRKLLISILPIPLVRIVSISAPIIQFTMVQWFLMMGALLFSSLVISIIIIGDPIERYGFRLPKRGTRYIEAIIILSGLGLGFIEFQILEVDAISLDTSPVKLLAPLSAIYLGTGLLEELLFRGVIQRHAIDSLGKVAGVALTTLIFMIMHTGWQSVPDIIFVGVVGGIFSIVVLKTGSLLGVSISHALVNLSLFIITPVHFG